MTDPADKNSVEIDFKDPFYVISHDTSEYWKISGHILRIFSERNRLYTDLSLEGDKSRFRQLLNQFHDSLDDKGDLDEQLDKEFPDVVKQEFPYLRYQNNKKWRKYLDWEDKITLPIVISFYPNRTVLEVYDNITL